jgi:serine-type D-Ala-D-Ala carboxypeptidase (penicillin-binding protein 5/6)
VFFAYKSAFALTLGALIAAPLCAEIPYDAQPGGVYYMVDVQSGAVLFGYDSDRRIPPASMAKMMTAYVAFDLLTQKKLSLDDQFVMPPELWRQWNNQGSTMFIASGQSVSVRDLLHGVITLSGNDASALLVHGISGNEAGFTTLMNEKAKEIGLRDSHFANAKGWPDGGKTYSTARDLGTIAERTLKDFPELYKQFYATTSFRFNNVEQPNRNPILGAVVGADGLKTGHIDEAGYGFTGSAVQDGRRLIMVIGGMPSQGLRVSESVKFINWGFKETVSKLLFQSGAIVGQANVQGGTSNAVDLTVDRTTGVAFFHNESQNVRLSIRYKGPLRAPIDKGAHVADLVITHADGSSIARPLYAGSNVGEGNVLHRILDGFFGVFS